MHLRHRLGHPPQNRAVAHLLHADGATGKVTVHRAVVELQVHRCRQASLVQRLRGDKLRVSVDERLGPTSVDSHQHQVVLGTPFVVQRHQLVGEAVHEHLGPGAFDAPVRSHVTQEVGPKVLQVAVGVHRDRDVLPNDAIYLALRHGHVRGEPERWG